MTSVAAPNISKILVGGYNQGGEIGAMAAIGAPEIDPASAASGLTLLLGALLVFRGRRVAKLDCTAAQDTTLSR